MAVRLVGKECISYMSGRSRWDKVVSLALDSAKANSNRLQILNETLRWENAEFVKSMLQFVASDECAGCADLLQELLRVTGRSWSPLVFKELSLHLGRNYMAFLGINATVPWICVDDLVVEHHPNKIGPPLVFGLQKFFQQLNMCAPISALHIWTPLTLEGLQLLIGLETKLPKTLALQLDFDAVQLFLQKLPLLSQLENLETLELSLINMDDARTSTFCDKVVKQPSAQLKEIRFRGGFGRQIHSEGMIAISKMVAALPELERLDVSQNHIGDAGFEAFSEAVAPVASISKLKFIDVSQDEDQHGNFGNVGVQALGKTLALLPALEEVVIRWNKNITDEGVVGLLSPFLNKSLPSLRKINMCWTNMSDAGVTVLAELMEKHPLEAISIDSTMITDKGLRLLGHALENATCLLKKVHATQYRSENKAWSDEGVRYLLQGLEHCPNLMRVVVIGPKLSNQTIQMALKALSAWQNLTMLYVTYGDRDYNLKEEKPLLWRWREGQGKVGALCLLRLFKMWALCDSLLPVMDGSNLWLGFISSPATTNKFIISFLVDIESSALQAKDEISFVSAACQLWPPFFSFSVSCGVKRRVWTAGRAVLAIEAKGCFLPPATAAQLHPPRVCQRLCQALVVSCHLWA